MKIEIGESLVYSWLRHVKKCQIVQTNWKTSPRWDRTHQNDVERMFGELKAHFGKDLFKGTKSVEQLLQQGECDLFGTTMNAGKSKYTIVEVAMHTQTLDYGSRRETVMKVLAKCIRAVFCLVSYFDSIEGEIIFASPKIGNKMLGDLKPAIFDLNDYFKKQGYSFEISVICNQDFAGILLDPTLAAIEDAEDTAELFARACKLLEMFRAPAKTTNDNKTPVYSILNGLLINGKMTAVISDLTTASFANSKFGLSTYPVLVKASMFASTGFDKTKFYKEQITFNTEDYYVCSQWSQKKIAQLQAWYDTL